MWQNTSQRYSVLSIGLHWFMLLLIAVYACMELREVFPKGSEPRELMKTWHFMLGLSVFVLVWVRLGARFFSGPTPPIKPGQFRWQMRLATLMHVALYVLMIGLPLLGWMLLSAKGKAIPFFGLHLPPLIAQSEYFAELFEEIHEAGATAGYVLVGLHTLAALFHHYVQRDNTLERMLPGKSTGR